ncbi:MAG: hypothetical protein A3B31_01120 [Candidatus Komeilibacteria bacterium RIFCSPLOWO2_01_FULL_53_11]|uniref:Uncharacterized protein n=1 Tax=Candidatus Komeilibacteria bacterium RIFCSPLOWO2_01_FULL_53_11 TaxID=1798552 RepID=A0A1G2BU76_9BACT|nr:MAG: hypothetical protein A3B31_01120 [Candidatus Komeilibacteria bacterium RIFCSPLOWO2_01_FULL_53_11]
MKRYAIYRKAGGKITKPPLGTIESDEKIYILKEASFFVIVGMTSETKEEFSGKYPDLTVNEVVQY